jgi:hypothetical protein
MVLHLLRIIVSVDLAHSVSNKRGERFAVYGAVITENVLYNVP